VLVAIILRSPQCSRKFFDLKERVVLLHLVLSFVSGFVVSLLT
jgi:hypothetical protein